MDKYSRSNFYIKKTVNGVLESDLITNTFNEFEFKNEFTQYTVTDDDVGRPDLVSFKLFNKVNYSWIIMKVNNIEDVWNDLYRGLVLSIPSEADIDNFYKTNKK